jgi:hypothetical protein
VRSEGRQEGSILSREEANAQANGVCRSRVVTQEGTRPHTRVRGDAEPQGWKRTITVRNVRVKER